MPDQFDDDYEAAQAEAFLADQGDEDNGGDGGGLPEMPPMPELPDGIGMSYEEVRALLAAKHKTILSEDDPILMMVTIMNADLAETEKLHQRHNKAVAGLMAAKTEEYIKAVKTVSATLSETLSGSSIAAFEKIAAAQGQRLERFRTSLFWAAAITTVSALVNVAVFVWR